jgi:hypothetical protein
MQTGFGEGDGGGRESPEYVAMTATVPVARVAHFRRLWIEFCIRDSDPVETPNSAQERHAAGT